VTSIKRLIMGFPSSIFSGCRSSYEKPHEWTMKVALSASAAQIRVHGAGGGVGCPSLGASHASTVARPMPPNWVSGAADACNSLPETADRAPAQGPPAPTERSSVA